MQLHFLVNVCWHGLLQKLINLRGPIEDPSPVSSARRSLTLVQAEGLLSYKVTSNLIASSTCGFSNSDIDPHLLTLLKVHQVVSLSPPSPLLSSFPLILKGMWVTHMLTSHSCATIFSHFFFSFCNYESILLVLLILYVFMVHTCYKSFWAMC